MKMDSATIMKKEFERLREEYDKKDEKREELIAKSRAVIKLSKKIIYSVHRGELKEAYEFVKRIKVERRKLQKLDQCEPYIKNAVQEYVEALVFFNYVKFKKIPTLKELKVGLDEYLLGLCDFTGELMRYATNMFINKDFNEVIRAKETLDKIYDELGLFDFRNGDIRRKYDSIKYSVKKVDELVIEIMKQKN